MQYRGDRYGNPLSALGYGCMRFPQKLGRIDMEETEKQLLRAIDLGVNYFDTAYIYGGSEAALGHILEKNGLRSRVHIATKLPHYLIKSKEGLDKLFNEQLRRLRTDYVDYYLMHMLTDRDTWQRLQGLGIEDWIQEKKDAGQIRQIGFSYHGNTEKFCRLIDAYDWDFCQIQYNYLDEHSQAGRRGLRYAAQRGIPVVIMEPLRGGKLVELLPERAKNLFAQQPVSRSPAQWGLRWLWDQKEVTVVLSGMNAMEMIEENCQTASQTTPGVIEQAELDVYEQVVQIINSVTKIGCTGCGYCQPCPKGVDIPGTFAAYNRYYSESKFSGLKEHIMTTGLRPVASGAMNCIGCGKCEMHCPQAIPIRQELKKAQKVLEGPIYRIGRKVIRWVAKF